MIITVSRPSSMDAKIVDEGGTSQDIISVQPRRYSKAQRKVNVFPFRIVREGPADAFAKNTSSILDQGYITLDVRTGKLVIEHRNEEIPVEPEKK